MLVEEAGTVVEHVGGEKHGDGEEDVLVSPAGLEDQHRDWRAVGLGHRNRF